ncbi:PRC-barrel domain containing protein [Paraburkholderia metrosideri]|jgi:sporulation protein YlmC with PRC-barrel domain|uniref:PRC-barrel domain-containing protein n=1 Tax=Paraburkholderia metrosideri TaxID=580937 RepID=A0ABM8NVK1_9BURK|nr:PRC-barrel domain-containing protein [Paraburkholderia metrosideri]CAD6545436.1 hypothetical protein LMG28140_04171 [Paraburkholderia metrosideri]
MKSKVAALVIMSASLGMLSSHSFAQVAGAQPLGVTVTQSTDLILGWSVKKSILNKPVYNENGEKVGVIHDIIVAPDRSVSYAIIAANQFLGVSHHDVAIPVEQLDYQDGKLILAGATKAAIKALPVFEYTKVKATPTPRAEYPHH